MNPVQTRPDPADSKTPPPWNRFDPYSYRLAVAVLWTVVIMVLCWLPPSVVHELQDESQWFNVPDLDKMVHTGIFVVFAILWARLWSSRSRFAWIALAGFGFAILTELVQRLPIVGRDGSVADTIVDCAGTLVGLVAAPLVEPLARFLESRLFRASPRQPGAVHVPTATVEGVARPSN